MKTRIVGKCVRSYGFTYEMGGFQSDRKMAIIFAINALEN